jgi:hypothetical protein
MGENGEQGRHDGDGKILRCPRNCYSSGMLHFNSESRLRPIYTNPKPITHHGRDLFVTVSRIRSGDHFDYYADCKVWTNQHDYWAVGIYQPFDSSVQAWEAGIAVGLRKTETLP